MRHNRIIILGGAGFVGSNLALHLSRYKLSSVTVFDNLSRLGSADNVPDLIRSGAKFVHGDVRNNEDMRGLSMQCPDLVIDCCAEPAVTAGYDAPKTVCDINLGGTINALELARQTDADFMFLSTSRVYPMHRIRQTKLVNLGNSLAFSEDQVLPGVTDYGISKDFPMNGIRSLYGATKYASELLIAEYADMFNVRTIVNRCGVIAGPRQAAHPGQGIFTYWLMAHHMQSALRYIGWGGTGQQTRDLLHVDDLCELIVRQSYEYRYARHQTYNVGGGVAHALSLAEATELCQEITGNKIHIGSEAAETKSDIPIYITDNRDVTAAFGWTPIRNPRQTLEDIYAWGKPRWQK
jgi:CDP-paratose 2-epimerase